MNRHGVVVGSGFAGFRAELGRSSRLSEGTFVQAAVRARLLGIPLLKVDATVMLIPASVTAPSSARLSANDLADAVRSINEGAAILAELRNGDGRRTRLRAVSLREARREYGERP